MGKVYEGHRTPDCEPFVLVRYNDHYWLPLAKYLHLLARSPTGFNWGYAGSGPAQLAFAMLMNLTDEELISMRYFQHFKRKFIVPLTDDSWTLEEEVLWAWVKEHCI